MGFKINDFEISALLGLPDIQQLLYILGIRRYMDFTTGIVGIARKISYQSLSEVLYTNPAPGIKGESRSKQQIQRALDGLEKSGLVKRDPLNCPKRGLVLKCLLASQDNFNQNKADSKPVQKRDVKPIQSKSVKSWRYLELGQKGNAIKSTKADTPPVSGNINNLSLKKSIGILIPENFQPSAVTITKAKQHQCPTATCSDELLKFISYHQSKGNRRCDWNAEYLGWLMRAKQYHQEKNYVKSKSVKQESAYRRQFVDGKQLSAVDRVLNANQELVGRQGEIIDHHG